MIGNKELNLDKTHFPFPQEACLFRVATLQIWSVFCGLICKTVVILRRKDVSSKIAGIFFVFFFHAQSVTATWIKFDKWWINIQLKIKSHSCFYFLIPFCKFSVNCFMMVIKTLLPPWPLQLEHIQHVHHQIVWWNCYNLD